ncbi:hypothetical protein [Bacillus solitudinis]|uniref:hypothetical protein n=1 Tax=Bacillus solitudinis TaxID=2014074 RepID=UPI000C243E7B|nr:hypothetical protein [Bacillus solitudinis]
MKSEVILDFCFMRIPKDGFRQEILNQLNQIFGDTIHWFLDVYEEADMEIVIAEIRSMGIWKSEKEIIYHLKENGTSDFLEWLKGYRMKIYPKEKGCNSGTNLIEKIEKISNESAFL